ncbi:restriction endonuclease subunit S [Trichlorobacter thiogenes]|nr:restriction endonuclease subunit S [Trichlorobacter thiogenes]
MADRLKVPELRFKGFDGEWEEKRLGDVAEEYYGGGTPRTSAADYWNGNIPWIQSSDIPEGQLSNIEPRKGISEQGIKSSATKLVPENSIAIVTRVGVGKLAFMPYKYSTSQDFLSLSKLKIDSWFATYLIWKKIQSELHSVQGTSIKGITKEELLSKAIMVAPPEKEQSQIGTFFQNLDSLITLHQRKYDKLMVVKKAMLHKMFPKEGADLPEIRFKGFTEKWERRTLGEVTPLRGGFAFRSNEFTNDGIPIVKISNILSNGTIGGEFDRYTEIEDDESFSLPDNAIVLAMSGATTGKVAVLTKGVNLKVYQNQRVGYFKNTGKIDYSLISTIVRSDLFTVQLNSVLVAGAQPNVSSKDIDLFEFTFPTNKTEQSQIGTFFQKLDSLITLQQRELDKLKNIKKACLEKMFI